MEFLEASHIEFDINDEDVALFVQSVRNRYLVPRVISPDPQKQFDDALDEHLEFLRNISRVEYVSEHFDLTDRNGETYSGAYDVFFRDGTVAQMGWKDSDTTVMLYTIS